MMLAFLIFALGLLIGTLIGVVIEDAFDLLGRSGVPWRRSDRRE